MKRELRPRETLGRVAYEALPTIKWPYEDLPESEQEMFEAMARAVAECFDEGLDSRFGV